MKCRPIVKTVEAYQYTGHNTEEFVERFGAEKMGGTLLMATTQGITSLDLDDWVAVSHEVRLSVVLNYAFKSRYEPAE